MQLDLPFCFCSQRLFGFRNDGESPFLLASWIFRVASAAMETGKLYMSDVALPVSFYGGRLGGVLEFVSLFEASVIVSY